MKDFKKYLKNKLKKQSIVGKATLSPPSSTESLQSSSALAVLDLLAEGPIEGLVKQNGAAVNPVTTLESLYLNKIPVKEPETFVYGTGNSKLIPYSSIKRVTRLTKEAIPVVLDSISGRLVSSILGITGGGLFADNSNYGLVQEKFQEISAFETELIDFVTENSGLARFGMVEYDVGGIFGLGDEISGRMSTNPTVDVSDNPYMTTNFQFNHLFQQGTGGDRLGGNFIKRQILDSSDNTIDIPDGFVIAAPTWTTSFPASGLGIGKVENMKRVEGFSGGGVFFFDAGTGDNDAADGFHLRTGRYFLDSSDSTITGELQKANETGYDAFIRNTSGISLERPSSRQITPSIGESSSSLLKIGLISDLLSKFNYNQVAFSFREGSEQQSVMDGYNTSSINYEANATLFGPLAYGVGAASGSGSGYSDIRTGGAGDYSAWMTNTPLEHDAYPYTHIVRNSDVDSCYPSIALEQLFDTIEGGDDAGVQKNATIALRIEYGFEGDVGEPETVTVGAESVNVGALISGGNSPKQIALKQFKKTLDKTYTSLIQSPYMTTISELDNLPLNSSLKNLRADATSIPGLTIEMLNNLGYTSGELLYPGDSWKDVNRYVRIQKTSHETDSNLIARDVSATHFSETINSPFVYPFSSLGATTFDARAFQHQPSREFDIRGKKILIPSNYEPLNTDGTDKRFVDSSEQYGLRKLYTFNDASYGVVEEMINLGTENIKFVVRTNKRTDGSPDNYIFDMKSRDGTSNSEGRIAIGNNGGNIFAIGKGGGNFYVTVAEGSLSASDVCEIELTIVGTSVNLKVTKLSDGSLVGESSSSYATSRPEIVFNPFAATPSNFIIGASTSLGGKMDSGGHIADLKIYKNNQLLHWWDGTVIYSERHEAQALRDKFGGAHALLNGTVNDVAFEDTDFTFGKNKNILYNGDWDGTFKLGWSDNPAWILYDLMINPTYGIGNNLDDREDINIFRLFELARFCDAVDQDGLFDGLPDSNKGLEPRFACNIRLDVAKNAFEVIGNMASIFRAITFWDGSFLNFTVDRPREIAGIFNNGNVYDGIFNYGDVTSSSRFTKVEVPYADAKDQFTTKYEYIEDEERMRRFGIITSQTNGIGCTSKSQARRLGKYIMLSNKLETEIVSFEAGNEVLFLEPGDVIRIDDEVKNFEINYGRILEIHTGSSPYFIIDDSVNANSIEIGAAGGIYTYNNKQQTELETLYDIVNFDRTETFGNGGAFGISGNNYSGKLPATAIENQNVEQISRFYISSTAVDGENSLKLNLDASDANFASITGVRTGSFFNVQLENQLSGEYKVVKISPRENNLYKVDAMQYERRKFDMIESEDFDLEENTHNIGIPTHTVNRPSAPTFGQDGPKYFYTPNSLQTLTGELVRANGSDETSYRLTLIKQNVSAPYVQKEFLTESDGTTFFELNGLNGGNYILHVNSLRNPESSQSLTYNFNIGYPTQVYIKTLFSNIEYDNDMNLNFQRNSDGTNYGSGYYVSGYESYGNYGSGLNYGSGEYYGNDVTYEFTLKDKYNRDVSISHLDYTIDVYAEVSGSFKSVKTGHKEQTYTFSEASNWITHGLESGAISKDYTLRFDLMQNSTGIDSGYCKTTII